MAGWCSPPAARGTGWSSTRVTRFASARAYRKTAPRKCQRSLRSGGASVHPFAMTPVTPIVLVMGLQFISDAAAGSFREPVGLQLYSLRAEFNRDVPGTLEKVHGYGIRRVELASTYNLTPQKFRQLLEANHLKATSGHFPFERYRDDPEGVARDARALGLRYAGCAWIPHEGDFDEKGCRAASMVFNKAGAVLARYG